MRMDDREADFPANSAVKLMHCGAEFNSKEVDQNGAPAVPFMFGGEHPKLPGVIVQFPAYVNIEGAASIIATLQIAFETRGAGVALDSLLDQARATIRDGLHK